MNKNTIVILVYIFSQFQSFGQNQDNKTFWSNSQVELSGLYGILDDYGVLIKGKKEAFNQKHFEGLYGLSFQYTYATETEKFANGIDGYNRDLGAYLVFDITYYPFKKKNAFISSELFSGYTNLKSKGTLSIPRHNIYNEYSNSYAYFNYGLTATIGYDFGRLKVGIFGMMSLRNMFKEDLIIPINEDSKAYLGLNLAYKL